MTLQIIKVEVHNFCSIHDGSFELQDYNLLVGANNSGKSNTINALRAFFGELTYSPDLHRPLVGQPDDEAWVEVTFKLTDDEYNALDPANQQSDKVLRVRRILRTAEEGRKPGLYAYEQTNLSKKAYKSSLGRIVYIPAVSKAEDQTKTSGPSPLRDVVNDILRTVTQSSPAYQQLVKSFEEFTGKIKTEKTNGDRSLQGLEDEITRGLEPWGIRFIVTIGSMSPDDIVKNLVSTRLTDQHVGKEQKIEQFGQGVQREIIFQLLSIKSAYLEEIGDNSTELNLLLFEEPEAFLHPTQQAELAERLRTISRDDGSQVLLSSHSPQFVSHESENLSSVIRLHRDNGRTLFGQISAARLQTIQTDNQQITPILLSSTVKRNHPHPDDQTLVMEAVKYFMWLDPNRCAMFFAARVLLVEGATEAVLINYLIKKKVLKAPQGTFVLDCLGKFNIHRFMQILSEMKVSHSVLFDDDCGKDIHPQLDTFIRSFSTPYTHQFDVLAGCIEDVLGVTATTSPHRKPQHMLYLYQTSQIDSAKLNAFVQRVEALVN
jgi:putative ATP-dependent endonuclease of OLD family